MMDEVLGGYRQSREECKLRDCSLASCFDPFENPRGKGSDRETFATVVNGPEPNVEAVQGEG